MTPFYEDKIQVQIGEGYVVLPVETLEHIANVYRALAEDKEDPDPWLNVARLVEEWTAHTGFYPEDYEGDEDDLEDDESD